MGVFFTIYYAIMAAGPPLAGWIYDGTGQPFAPIVFGILLFALVIPCNFLFRAAIRRKSEVGVEAG
jgi:MFS family permease